MEEVWKDVPGYEGRYQVSDYGRVRSQTRVQHFKAYVRSDGAVKAASTRTLSGKVLKPGRMVCGHLSLPLGRGSFGQLVHRLVMSAFVGPAPSGMEVLHLNHDPADNRLCNLKYGTRSENLKMDYARGVNRLHGKRGPAV
jgi:hypothetical protein